MIRFSQHKKLLESNGYILPEGWVDLMEDEYGGAVDFVDNHHQDIVLLVAADSLTRSPIDTMGIKHRYVYTTTDGVEFETLNNAEKHQLMINKAKNRVVENVDLFLSIVGIDEDDISYAEVKDVEEGLDNIRRNIKAGVSTIKISNGLQYVLEKYRDCEIGTVNELTAPGWWFVKDNGFVLFKGEIDE